jgi:hypothetical protein
MQHNGGVLVTKDGVCRAEDHDRLAGSAGDKLNISK